jgi:hypothetical protein
MDQSEKKVKWDNGGILSGVEFQFLQRDRQGSKTLKFMKPKLSQTIHTLGLERKC